MSDDEHKKKELAKKLVEISHEDKRYVQFQLLKAWQGGYITGRECLDEVVGLEKIIYLDTNYLKGLRNGKIQKP